MLNPTFGEYIICFVLPLLVSVALGWLSTKVGKRIYLGFPIYLALLFLGMLFYPYFGPKYFVFIDTHFEGMLKNFLQLAVIQVGFFITAGLLIGSIAPWSRYRLDLKEKQNKSNS